mgnify:CR=1 FL=1
MKKIFDADTFLSTVGIFIGACAVGMIFSAAIIESIF